MNESLRQTIEDIRRKLKSSVYQNEEHVRLSLVARIVQELGWDIWNPGEVNTEFAVAPDEDKTKVDMALFARDGYPAVLIEIKAVGKMEGNLETIEIQVRNYNRDITAPFSIITDGQIWRFYYVKGEGTFSQKLFDKLDLTEPNTFKISEKLESYLSKDEIRNGNAEEEAKKRLNVTQKQETMANSYADAEMRMKREPFPNLPDALIEVMKFKGFEITRQEAEAYIRSRSEIQLPPPSSKFEKTQETQNDKTRTTSSQVQNWIEYINQELLGYDEAIRVKNTKSYIGLWTPKKVFVYLTPRKNSLIIEYFSRGNPFPGTQVCSEKAPKWAKFKVDKEKQLERTIEILKGSFGRAKSAIKSGENTAYSSQV